jgi:hypothetical protein
MMVIIGYKILNGDLQLRVNNPLPMSEGSQSWMSYEDYVAVDNDHRHWNDYYDVQ